MHLVLPALGPQHDEAADHQGRGHGNGVEQVGMDQVGEDHPQHHRRQEGDQQVDREALGLGLGRQADHHIEDLAAKFPDNRKDRPQLDNDVEGHRPLAAKVEQVGHNDLVSGAADG